MSRNRITQLFLLGSIFIAGFWGFIQLNEPTSKEKYIQFLKQHTLYQTRYDMSPNRYGKTPDKAWEQDFLRTLDPATGKPEPERLVAIHKMVNQKMAKPSGVPGSGANTQWVERGPNNVAGRTRALMYDPNAVSGNKVWAGGVTGGLWYNNDITSASTSWIKVNDFWDNIAVTCIAYDPTNTQIMYVGTGEGWGTGSSRGGGIWKTTDGGATWNKLGSTNGFFYVNDIVVRNENNNGVVYAAVDGRFYNGIFHGSANSGLQRSTNGGTSWSQVLPNVPSESINFVPADIEIAADNRIWIGTKASIFSANDRGGGRVLYSDNGTSFTTSRVSNVTNGDGRVEVACAPSNANYVYAMVEDQSQVFEILKSTNKGSSWTNLPEPNDDDNGIPANDFSRGQAWYDLILGVDPNNPDRLIAGAINLHMSTNGGSSWSQISKWSNNPNMGVKNYSYVHADQHAITFKPGQSNEVIFGTDGGVFYTNNLTSAANANVISARNKDYNITQFYACAMHPSAGVNYFLTGSQDNGSHAFSSPGMNSTVEVNGGDGAFCFIDQVNPNYQITSYIYNTYDLSTNGGSSFNNNIVNDQNTGTFINTAAYDSKLGILFSAKNNSEIWRFSGIKGSINQSTIAVAGMQTMASALKVSPYPTNSTTLFIGTEDGSVFRLTNANNSPTITNITGGNFPNGSVSCIELGASDNEIIVIFSNYGVQSVWYSSNGGSTWQSKEGNLPDMPVRWALINPLNADEVILATEVGVWGTDDFTSPSPTWSSSNSGLANVRVDMLQTRGSDNEVIAATHGRGLFSSSGFAFTGQPSQPVANTSIPFKFFCIGDSIQLNDQSTGLPNNWSWRIFGPTTVNSSQQNPKIALTTQGSYSVELIVSNTVGADTILLNDAIYIGQNPIEVTLKTDNFGSEITWELLDNSGNIIDAGGPYNDVTNGETFYNFYCLPNGCYKFKIYDSFGDGICCANGNGFYQVKSLSNNIITNTGGTFGTVDSALFCLPVTGAAPLANFTYSTNTVCVGDTVYFFDNSINAPTSWSWIFQGGDSPDTTIANPIAVYSAPGTYSVTMVASNNLGSDVEFKQNIIIVQPGPSVTLTGADDFCDNENVSITITPNTKGGTWSLSWDNSMTDTAFFNPSKLGVGSYNVTYALQGGNGCVTRETQSFSIKAAPNVTLSFTDTICVGAESFAISGGLPTGGVYTGFGIENGMFQPAGVGSGIYALKYVYDGANGCSDSAFSTIVVDVCASSNSLIKNSKLNFYPNPANNNLFIDVTALTEITQIEIITASGNIVYQNRFVPGSFDVLNINTESFAKGVYFIVLKDNFSIKTHKALIMPKK